MRSGSTLCRGMSLALLLSLAFSGPALAEPVGKLLPLSDTGEQMLAMKGKTPDDVMNEIPSHEAVGLPIYPNAFFGEELMAMGQLAGVSLLTSDPIEQVKAWYAEQEGLNWSDDADAFYVGEAYIGVTRTETIRLEDLSGAADDGMAAGLLGMTWNISDMNTLITLRYLTGKGE